MRKSKADKPLDIERAARLLGGTAQKLPGRIGFGPTNSMPADDKITAARLKADGWHQCYRGSKTWMTRISLSFWLRVATDSDILFAGSRNDMLGPAGAYVRTVAGIADLRAIVACLRGETK